MSLFVWPIKAHKAGPNQWFKFDADHPRASSNKVLLPANHPALNNSPDGQVPRYCLGFEFRTIVAKIKSCGLRPPGHNKCATLTLLQQDYSHIFHLFQHWRVPCVRASSAAFAQRKEPSLHQAFRSAASGNPDRNDWTSHRLDLLGRCFSSSWNDIKGIVSPLL